MFCRLWLVGNFDELYLDCCPLILIMFIYNGNICFIFYSVYCYHIIILYSFAIPFNQKLGMSTLKKCRKLFSMS